MGSVKVLLGAAAVAAIGTAARAADLPPIMPIMKAPIVEEFSGWYLRGDIGMTNQRVSRLDNVLFATTANLVIHDKNFESGMMFGVGVGYQFNSWIRVDVTGEYRGETGFHGFDTWTDGNGDPRFNNYTGKKSEWLFLANLYADLGTWWCITPFVGVGIGASYNTIHSFRDAGIDPAGPSPTMAYANAASQWNFAWALHAGLAYKATPSLTLELAYRYLDLGNAQSGDIIAFDGTNSVNNPMRFNGITSHDLKLGVRWLLQPDVMPPPMLPPLVRKG